MSKQLYEKIEPLEEGDLVQYVGTYVTRMGEAPYVGFRVDEEATESLRRIRDLEQRNLMLVEDVADALDERDKALERSEFVLGKLVERRRELDETLEERDRLRATVTELQDRLTRQGERLEKIQERLEWCEQANRKHRYERDLAREQLDTLEAGIKTTIVTGDWTELDVFFDEIETEEIETEEGES